MRWRSVRVRLTLWNVLVLFLALGGFGLVFTYSVQASQSAAIDRELLGRTRRFTDNRDPARWADFWKKANINAPKFEWPGSGTSGARLTPPGPMPWGRSPGPPPGATLGGGKPSAATPGSDTRNPDDLRFDRQRYFGRSRLFDPQGFPPNWASEDEPWDREALQRALQGEGGFTSRTVEGEPLRIYTVPVIAGEKVWAVVQVPHSMREHQMLIESQVQTLLLLLPMALLVTGLGGLFLASRALRPVRDVTRAADQIGAEDLSQRLSVSGNDELAELARTFNGMIARLESAFAGQADAYRRLEDAYEEQRRFTGDASHELRTPLARIKGATSLALCGPNSEEEYREALTVADQAADAMDRIVRDLLLLARADAGQMSLRRSPVSVEMLFERTLDTFDGHDGAQLLIDAPAEPLYVMGDVDHLSRLLINLVSNALRHTPKSGTVTLAAAPDTRGILLTVTDTGEGIAAEHLPHLCERFYRVDAARARSDGGTGLGLAICQTIAHAHGGELGFQSEVGFGATVMVRLPRAVTVETAAIAAPAPV